MTRTTAALHNRWGATARDAALVTAMTGLTVLAARIAVPLPWTPVPATFQVAAVILTGAALGARRGAMAQLLYLLLGVCGLPVFAATTPAGPAVVLSPTFGYLLAFPAAAWLAGRWARTWRRWLGAAAGLGAIYVAGTAWLTAWALAGGLAVSLSWSLLAGVLVFLPFDLIEATLAVWSARPLRRRLDG